MNLKEFKENGVAWDASWVFGDLLIRKYEYKGTCSDGRVAFEEQRWRYNYQTGQVTAEKDNRALVRSIVMRKLILIACYPTREEAIQSLIDECDSRMENLKKELETLPKVKTWLQELKQGAFALAADSSGQGGKCIKER